MVEFILGILVGSLLFYLFFERKKPSGTFVFDFSDMDKDVCRLELDDDIHDIYDKKRIVLNVKVYENSQK